MRWFICLSFASNETWTFCGRLLVSEIFFTQASTTKSISFLISSFFSSPRNQIVEIPTSIPVHLSLMFSYGRLVTRNFRVEVLAVVGEFRNLFSRSIKVSRPWLSHSSRASRTHMTPPVAELVAAERRIRHSSSVSCRNFDPYFLQLGIA